MHKDADHNGYAYYGIGDHRYKLTYWYNESFDLPGTSAGGQPKEWELFDCIKNPLELLNIIGDPQYRDVVQRMIAQLDGKIAEIGDEPEHIADRFDFTDGA